MTANERDVLLLLSAPAVGYMSPTQIAQALHPDTGRHSAWASPICKRLVERGLLERNERGWYACRLTLERLIVDHGLRLGDADPINDY